MRIYSFIQKGIGLVPVEVELSLLPGTPQAQFMGLPDAVIKESVMRVQSALKHQGFEWPRAKRVLINLRPSYLKKTSRGMDLAIACALLWKTGQLPPPGDFIDGGFIYGELGLEGEVSVPDDLDQIVDDSWGPILTGKGSQPLPFPVASVGNLGELMSPEFQKAQDLLAEIKRPELPPLSFSKAAAELLMVAATGEHSLMLAGPAGSGKTTFAECLYYLLKKPRQEVFRRSRQIARLVGEELRWRPYRCPHHTTPPLAMIGGGYPPFPGELTRAHGGMLVMDEYLEFHPRVQEALREPMEKGKICVSRRGQAQTFPANFMLVATTNLCPCGDLVPGRPSNCQYSLTRCRSHIEKLSGPVLDRFDVLGYSHLWSTTSQLSLSGSNEEVELSELAEKVSEAHEFQQEMRPGQLKPNGQLDVVELEVMVESFSLKNLMPTALRSRRRRRALLRVARSLADLEKREEIGPSDLEKAYGLTVRPFERLRQTFA